MRAGRDAGLSRYPSDPFRYGDHVMRAYSPANTGMTATLPSERIENGRNLSPQKETVRAYVVIGIGNSRSDVETVAAVRFYMARSGDGASPVYCSIWIHGRCAGHGRATGYGYHKLSAALDAALSSAGVTLSQRIDGCGDAAMESAMYAVGIAAGFNTVRVIQA